MLQALLCTLIVRAGCVVTVSVARVAAIGNKYRLCLRADWRRKTVFLSV
jgi:hypothetical protein